MSELLRAVRSACSPGTWSKAVELARAGNVSALSASEFRVATDGGLKSASVQLYPEDDEWSCDCDSTAEACLHAAAAAIAWNQARASGRQVAVTLAHVGYRLHSDNGALVFGRVVADEPLLTSLTEAVQQGKKLAATQADMAVEVLLGTRPRGALTPEHWRKLWPALKDCEDITVDGAKVSLGEPRAIERPVVVDDGDGFALRLEQHADKVWGNGLGLADGTLFPIMPSELRATRIDDVAHFVSDVLPALTQVEIRTARLPKTTAMHPRVHFDIQAHGAGVQILPVLMYGDSARVDGTTLKWLGGPLPQRLAAVEEKLRLSVVGLGLQLGQRKFVLPDEAPDMLARISRFEQKPRLVAARIEASGGPLRLSLRAGTHTVDHEALVRAVRSGQAVIELGDGLFAEVPPPLRHPELVARLLQGRPEPAQQVAIVRLLRQLDVPLPPDYAPIAHLLDGDLPRAELPADLTATLRGYQRDGVDWLRFMKSARLGALLADDMGLGKTLQTIAALDQERTLIVAPTSVLAVWENELRRFRPLLRVHRHHGARRGELPACDVVLTTYGLLRQGELADRQWDVVVLDEAQAIKNADSQTARACFALKAQSRIALSGTPVENSLDELWSIFHFLNPGYLGERAGYQVEQDKLRPFILRRKKESVARDLPPRTDNVLSCELSSEERAIYDAVYNASVPSVLQALEESGSVLSALEALLRLRQAACHPRLLPGYDSWPGEAAKLKALLPMLDSLRREGHRALVFSQWTSLLDLVEPHLDCVRLDGATVDRDAVVRRFEAEDGPPVMLISLKAGGTGLTLTAADYVFLLDPWWNPAVEEQAAARAHRIGQTKPVFVYRLIAAATVEERLLALQEKKRALFDVALGDDALAQRLTREDLRVLLG